MPTVKKWHVPRGLKPMVSGRKVRTTLLQRVERLVEGNVIPRPVWYDAALAHPPPPRLQVDRPKNLVFPEDELRREWLRRNPAATMVPKALFLEEDSIPAELREHPGDVFVKKQMGLIEKGMDPDEAYRAVKAEQDREASVEELETQTARKVAAALGAAPADDSKGSRIRAQQQLLRRFAEEARDMGLPYPKHWFAEDGSWKGIGAQSLRASLAANTRRALDRTSMGEERSKSGDDLLLSMIRERSNLDGGRGRGKGSGDDEPK